MTRCRRWPRPGRTTWRRTTTGASCGTWMPCRPPWPRSAEPLVIRWLAELALARACGAPSTAGDEDTVLSMSESMISNKDYNSLSRR
jgi:hypothetical protein